jgi:hypothetical protein
MIATNLTQAQVCGRAQRFPELAFLQFAVAREHEYAPRCSAKPVGERHALGLRDAHPQRTGIGLHERRLDVGMSRQSMQAPKLMELVFRQQAKADEHVVQRRRVVAPSTRRRCRTARDPCRDRAAR